jgi:tetratricopeptide (TPR) repeat protein
VTGAGRPGGRLWWLWCPFLLGLAVRLAYLAESADAPTFWLPIVDARTYLRLGALIAEGAADPRALFWQSPAYPVILALFHRLSGHPLLSVKLFGALLGAIACALAATLGARLGGRRAGLAAGCALALYGPAIFHDGEVLTAGWESPLALALLLLAPEAARRGRGLLPALLGLTGGLAVLIRPTFLPFVVALAAWLGWRVGRRDGPRRGWLALLGASSGMAALLLPTSAACLAGTGRFTFLSASGGINLYIGNHPDFCRLLSIRPGWEWNRLTRLPSERGVTGFWEQADWFSRETARIAAADVPGFARRMCAKTLRLVNSRELPRNDDSYLYRDWSAILRMSLWKAGRFGFPFGVLLPLAVFGAVVLRRRLPGPLWLFLAVYPASIVLAFPSGRYRMALIPPLLAVAAAGVVEAAVRVRSLGAWRALARPVAAGVLAVAVSAGPGAFCEERLNWRAALWNSLAVSAENAGEADTALGWHRRAVATAPGDAGYWNDLGVHLVGRGRYAEALAALERVVALRPDSAEALNNRAYALIALGRHDLAAASLREALRIIPRYALAWNNLGNALRFSGDLAGAREAYRRALEIEPGYPAARQNLDDLGGA